MHEPHKHAHTNHDDKRVCEFVTGVSRALEIEAHKPRRPKVQSRWTRRDGASPSVAADTWQCERPEHARARPQTRQEHARTARHPTNEHEERAPQSPRCGLRLCHLVPLPSQPPLALCGSLRSRH